jgi:hypothetical protein
MKVTKTRQYHHRKEEFSKRQMQMRIFVNIFEIAWFSGRIRIRGFGVRETRRGLICFRQFAYKAPF